MCTQLLHTAHTAPSAWQRCALRRVAVGCAPVRAVFIGLYTLRLYGLLTVRASHLMYGMVTAHASFISIKTTDLHKKKPEISTTHLIYLWRQNARVRWRRILTTWQLRWQLPRMSYRISSRIC